MCGDSCLDSLYNHSRRSAIEIASESPPAIEIAPVGPPPIVRLRGRHRAIPLRQPVVETEPARTVTADKFMYCSIRRYFFESLFIFEDLGIRFVMFFLLVNIGNQLRCIPSAHRESSIAALPFELCAKLEFLVHKM